MFKMIDRYVVKRGMWKKRWGVDFAKKDGNVCSEYVFQEEGGAQHIVYKWTKLYDRLCGSWSKRRSDD